MRHIYKIGYNANIKYSFKIEFVNYNGIIIYLEGIKKEEES